MQIKEILFATTMEDLKLGVAEDIKKTNGLLGLFATQEEGGTKIRISL